MDKEIVSLFVAGLSDDVRALYYDKSSLGSPLNIASVATTNKNGVLLTRKQQHRQLMTTVLQRVHRMIDRAFRVVLEEADATAAVEADTAEDTSLQASVEAAVAVPSLGKRKSRELSDLLTTWPSVAPTAAAVAIHAPIDVSDTKPVRTLEELKVMVREIMDAHGLGSWTTSFSTRATTTAGVTYHSRQIIDITAAYGTLAPEAALRDIILHEVAHALVGASHAHDAVWKAKARSIGCTGELCHNVTFTKAKNVTSEEEELAAKKRAKRTDFAAVEEVEVDDEVVELKEQLSEVERNVRDARRTIASLERENKALKAEVAALKAHG